MLYIPWWERHLLPSPACGIFSPQATDATLRLLAAQCFEPLLQETHV